jgi:hypothetical protein
MDALLAAGEPAGGAALGEVFLATAMAAVATGVLLWLIAAHRAGKAGLLTRASEKMADAAGLPGWASLPSAVAAVSLMVALVGMYWDIALHIGEGRDAGPLANPAHYLILAGLFGVFAAGCMAIALPRKGERPGPAALKITDEWYAPVGGVLIAACGAFALIGFPLDDVWHRLFGQDVTLWGPTHLMLIGGAGMTLIGQAVLLQEGMRARRDAGEGAAREQAPSKLVAFRRVGLMGGLLTGLCTFQAEFDFGVPQFDQVFHPMLIALAAGVGLVCSRIWIGRGGALLAAVFFLVVRGIISLIVGPGFGTTTPALPLFLGSAVCVEAVAFALARRPVAFGAVGGLLAGTVGFATEWAWSHAVMRLPWEAGLMPEGLITSIVAGTAGGVVGALLALGLRGELPRPAVARALSLGSLVAVGAVVAAGLLTSTVQGRTSITTTAAGPGEVNATVRVEPTSLTEDAKWVTVTAWQGGGLVVDRLERVAEGVYRTTSPIPVSGNWKTLVRVHTGGDALAAAPIFMPEDKVIPAPEIPARPQVTRRLGEEKPLLQRELKQDVAPWLWPAANILVLALYLAFLGSLAWGVARIARRDPRQKEEPPPSTRTGRFDRDRAPAPTAVPG